MINYINGQPVNTDILSDNDNAEFKYLYVYEKNLSTNNSNIQLYAIDILRDNENKETFIETKYGVNYTGEVFDDVQNFPVGTYEVSDLPPIISGAIFDGTVSGSTFPSTWKLMGSNSTIHFTPWNITASGQTLNFQRFNDFIFYNATHTVNECYLRKISENNYDILPKPTIAWNLIKQKYTDEFANLLNISYLTTDTTMFDQSITGASGNNMTMYNNQEIISSFYPAGNFYPINNTINTPPTAFIPDYIDDHNIIVSYITGNTNVETMLPTKIVNGITYFNFSPFNGYNSNVILSSNSQIFYKACFDNNSNITGVVMTNQLEIPAIDVNSVYNLWKNRTGIIYTKMKNIWESIRYTKLEEYFSNESLAEIINAYTKIRYLQYPILAIFDKTITFPYNTSVNGFGYNIDTLIKTYTSAADTNIVSSFVGFMNDPTKDELFTFE